VGGRSARRRRQSAGDRSELPRLSGEQEPVVYRIAQEALTNVARHARARHAKLALEQVDGELLLTVRDDGEGFGGSPTVESGIRGMRERALLVRGMLKIRRGLIEP